MQKSMCPWDVKQRITADIDAKSHRGTKCVDISNLNKGYAPFDLIVKAIRQSSNTVFFESIEPVETPAFIDYECGYFTHDNYLNENIKVGAIIKQGTYMYDAGGKGSGVIDKFDKHIHTCWGRGKLKTFDKSTGGYWYNVGNGNYEISSTGGAIDIADAYFIPLDLEIDQSKETQKRTWTRIGEESMDIQKGIQTITYKGKQFAILYQPDGYEPYLLSLKHPALYPLSLINVKEWDIYGKKNASVFEMKQNANYGYVYGSEVSDIYDEAVPTSQGLIDVVKLKDGTWKFGNFGYDKYRKDEVILRYSTYMVLVAGGVYSNERSKFDISTTNTKMSCLFVNWSNEALFVVSIDNASLDEMRSLAMELGMQYAFVDDSGGSASIVAKGKVYSGNSSERAIPNCLAFVKSTDLPHNEKPIEPPIQPPLEDDKDKRIAELEKENQELTKKIENAKIALG